MMGHQLAAFAPQRQLRAPLGKPMQSGAGLGQRRHQCRRSTAARASSSSPSNSESRKRVNFSRMRRAVGSPQPTVVESCVASRAGIVSSSALSASASHCQRSVISARST
jgi:hypothetical protein